MAKADMPVQAMRELLDSQLTERHRISISRDELDRQASAEHLGEDVAVAIHELPPGKYTRAQLEAQLLPEIDNRVRARLAGLGGGPSDPSGHKGSRQARQRGRK